MNDLLLETRRDDPGKALWDRYGETFRAFARLPEKDRAMIEEQIKRLSAYAAAVEGAFFVGFSTVYNGFSL